MLQCIYSLDFDEHLSNEAVLYSISFDNCLDIGPPMGFLNTSSEALDLRNAKASVLASCFDTAVPLNALYVHVLLFSSVKQPINFFSKCE